jgi:hypothetical protein
MEDIEIIIILIIASIMGLADYFGHFISGLAGKNRDNILSFSSGLLISLLFLILVPDLITINDSSLIFLYLLIGFLLMHLAEKYLYKHVTNKQELLEDLKVLHIIGFGLDNFLVGFIIASLLEINLPLAIFLSAPLFLQMLTSSFSLDSIDIQINDRFSKILLSILPIFGAIVGLILEFEAFLTSYVLALVLGILFYMIIRDVIPQAEKGSILLFFIGSGISILLWLFRILT